MAIVLTKEEQTKTAVKTIRKVKNVLSISSDAKTMKGEKYGFLTGIMYFSPHNIAGYGNICPLAFLAQCADPCLNTAGRGAFNSIQLARINKTAYFHEYYNEFMNTLVKNIAQLKRKAMKKGLTPLVRLNGTSDIMWEDKNVEVTEKTSEYLFRYHNVVILPGSYKNIMEVFPDVQFYDYTKIAMRFGYDQPKNYDLTFSYSGVKAYQKSVQYAKKHNARIAVVFRDAEKIPSEFMGLQVVSGDNSDIRHLDPKNSIVALYAKGKGKRDTSGFVVD